MREIIPIFFACDDQYVKYMIVAMKSIILHASNTYQYEMYVLHVGISDAMKNEAAKLQQENVHITFVDVSEEIKELEEQLPLRDYYSMTTYYRLFMADLFPQYDKAIYIDSDTVTLSDISKLYQIDIEDNLVAAVRDQAVLQNDIFGEYVEKVLGIARDAYFNAGMLVMNCKAFREEEIQKQFVNLLHAYTFVVAQDQDYLNIICEDRVHWLSPVWNTMIFGEIPCKEEDICILHYNMASKPWHNKMTPLSDFFWDVAKQTDVYDMILEGLEAYTDEQRSKDARSGQGLLDLAVSEISKEDNYWNMKQKEAGKSKERLEILEKIAELERAGKFDVDVENDPPAPPLLPDEINYLHKNLGGKLRTRYAYKIARWFLNFLIHKKQIIVKEIRGIENFQNLDSGAILTCNHFSPLDSFAMQIVYDQSKHRRRRMFRIIREGNYTGFPGFYGFLMRNCDTLPLSSNADTMKKFVRAVDALLKKGHFILIYPEQSMWWNYRKPKPLKKSAFSFAARNNVPVLPIFITMEDSDVLDQDGFFVQEYTIHVDKPIYPDPSKSRPENAEMMKKKNYEIWKRIYEDTYQIPLTYTCDEDKIKY